MTDRKADPTAEMTERELAEYYDHTHDLSEFEGGEIKILDPQRQKRLDVSISVRFNPEQMDEIERQADETGLKVTTYIRTAALAGGQASTDLLRIQALVR